MKPLCVLFLIAISSAMAMQIRTKRQSTSDDDSKDLEDRHGWQGRPQLGRQWKQRLVQTQFPGQFPGQGQFPGWGQFPGQDTSPSGQGQWLFPGQGQWLFPGQGQFPGQWQWQFPGQGQFPTQIQFRNQQQKSLISTPSKNGGTSQQQCITQCPATAEYSPVCGTDMVQYTNPGRLACAQGCGVNVTLLRSSPCAVSTTAAPT